MGDITRIKGTGTAQMAVRPRTTSARDGAADGDFHMPTGRTTVTDPGLIRRAGAWLAAGLSFGAAAIHLAAGPHHVDALGDLGLAFYWAALFQAATAFALLSYRHPRRLAWIAIAGNLTILAAWGWSRIVGLPTVPGGPESIGIADGIASLLQAGLVVVLAVQLRGIDVRWSLGRGAAPLRSVLAGGLVASLGAIALSTVIAVNAAAAGEAHGHAPANAGEPDTMPMTVGMDHGHDGVMDGATTAP